MSTSDAAAMRKRWQDDISTIRQRTVSLTGSYRLYRDFFDVASQSPVGDKQSYFWYWLQKVYSTYALVSMRTLCEHERPEGTKGRNMKRRQTASLHILLREIKDNHSVLSRSWYIQQYPHGDMYARTDADWPRRAVDDFKCEYGRRRYILSKKDIQRDIRRLEACIKPIKAHVDQIIAHLEREPSRTAPLIIKVAVFEQALECIKDVVRKYGAILTGVAWDLVPDIGPWRFLFRQAWIQEPPDNELTAGPSP